MRYSKTGLLTVLLVVGGVSILGYSQLRGSHAATPFLVMQTEDGTLRSPATEVTDGTASYGSAVRFGSNSDTPDTVLVSSDFEKYPLGALSKANFKDALNDTVIGAADLGYTSIVNSPDHGKVIRETLPANLYAKGITTDTYLPRAVDEASIQYDIIFNSGFEWSGGGKLPGLGGSKSGINPSIAGGCAAATGSAWSGRGMWIGKSVFSSIVGTNEWIGYMYNAFKTADCGENIRPGKAFIAGGWHSVKQQYKMNTVTNGVANADGEHRMWLDGTLIYESTKYRYRSDTSLHINNIYWEIFRGGGDDRWIAPHDGMIDIDNLLVTTP